MRILSAFLSVACITCLTACSGASPTGAVTPNTASAIYNGNGRYIVVLKGTSSMADVASLGNSLASRPQHSYGHALIGFAATLSPNEKTRLLNDPRVDYIEPDLDVHMTKGKPGGSPGGGGGGGAQETPWGIARIGANANTGSKGAGVGVAVFDTGIDLDHPDLGAVVDGFNAFSSTKPADDDNGHGTHVAGTIAALDNATGVVGVAPSANLIAIKILDRRGSGSISGIIAGINWTIANKSAHNIQVGNMSLTAYGSSNSFRTAVINAKNAGITLCCASGNDYGNASNYIPASYPEVICVTALDPDGTFATYSNNGPVVDIIAPGTSIKSCWKGGGYKTISGTSMATPHVTGSVALFLDSSPNATWQNIYDAITNGENAPAGGWVGDSDGIAEDLVDARAL